MMTKREIKKELKRLGVKGIRRLRTLTDIEYNAQKITIKMKEQGIILL